MDSSQNACVFCTQPEGRARMITSNGLAWAFPTNIPIVWGHTLIVPERCVADWDQLAVEEQRAILDLAYRVKQALIHGFKAEGFHVIYNEGRVAGQSVPHFHLHVVPRYSGDTGIIDYEPRKFLYRPGSRESTPEAELIEVAGQVRRSLI